MFEIKDLVGLSEPLAKLVDVCSKGLGNIIEPHLIRKRADAKAYEIETITKALKSQKEIGLLPHTVYSDGKLEIITEHSRPIENDFSLIQNEIFERKYFQEIKKQGNINNTINFTMNELEKETEVSSQDVDEDWILRYFNTIENISNEQMQQLWAKILAGEIKQPNTYSLRTLDLLKNLSLKEAEIFSKVASLSFVSAGKNFILGNDDVLKNQFNITFADILLLQDLGLIHTTKLALNYEKAKTIVKSHLIYGNEVIEVEQNEKSPNISLQVYAMSIIGSELLELVDIPLNNDYIKEIAKAIKLDDTIKVSTCTILDGSVQDSVSASSNS